MPEDPAAATSVKSPVASKKSVGKKVLARIHMLDGTDVELSVDVSAGGIFKINILKSREFLWGWKKTLKIYISTA